jgi:UDP-glucose 6-dehydrogenase
VSCNSNFAEFSYLLGCDERIGHSHTEVPGWDGKFGWGGHCFNKDNLELEKFSNSRLVKFIRQLNQEQREHSELASIKF